MTKVKEEIVHYDFFGNQIKKDMIVILSYGTRGHLELGKVIKINKKLLNIEILHTKRVSYLKSTLRYPSDLVIIDEDIAANYLLNCS
jgi:hypothetical protein